MPSTTFKFDDLPLVHDNGFEGAEIAGEADLEYYFDSDGDCLITVENIRTNVSKIVRRLPNGVAVYEHKTVDVGTVTSLGFLIRLALEVPHWQERMVEACAEDAGGSGWRGDAYHHGTLNRVQQGIARRVA